MDFFESLLGSLIVMDQYKISIKEGIDILNHEIKLRDEFESKRAPPLHKRKG